MSIDDSRRISRSSSDISTADSLSIATTDEIEVIVPQSRRRGIERRRFIELGEPEALEDLGGLIRPAERVTDNEGPALGCHD
jgi:hypothetical protein